MSEAKGIMEILGALKTVEELSKKVEQLEKDVKELKSTVILNKASETLSKEGFNVADLIIEHYRRDPPRRS